MVVNYYDLAVLRHFWRLRKMKISISAVLFGHLTNHEQIVVVLIGEKTPMKRSDLSWLVASLLLEASDTMEMMETGWLDLKSYNTFIA